MHSEIVSLNKERNESWNRFCVESNDAWFWHTTQCLDYYVAYGRDNFQTKNLSFIIQDNSEIVAICPLLLEEKTTTDSKKVLEFSTAGGGGYGVLPALKNDLGENHKEKIYKTVFEYIDQLAREYGVVRTLFRFSPLSLNQYGYNLLMKYGYFDNSLNTQVIDLTLSLEQIWKNVRKGNKYDIHRGEKNYDINIYSKDNPDKEAFDQYRLLHHKAAGRITRPIETFEMMYDWILAGNGMLCGVSKDGRYAGFSYIILYKDGACYGSASDDPDFMTDIPISHVIQWKAIEWLKEKGYRTYEIGQQQFGAQIHDIPSPKELSISFFKRGFGGQTVSSYRGVKYYNKEFMEADMRNNLNNLLSHYLV